MVHKTEVVTIARSASEIWAVLADFGAIVQWAPNVDHSCLTTDSAEGVDVVRRIQTGRQALLERIVEWEPDRRLSYTIEGLPPIVRSVTNTWELAPTGASTIVSLTSEVDAGPRPPQKLAAKGVATAMAKASRQMLDGLDEHLRKVNR